jgi:hypothetical protein
MGIPAQFDNPRFPAAMDLLVETGRRRGVAAVFMTAGRQDAIPWIDRRFRAVCPGSDVMTIVNTPRARRRQVEEHVDSQRKPGASGLAR